MGSGTHEHADLAEPVGALIARFGAHLLTGGGSGVMLAAARGFVSVADRAGLVVGVLPGDSSGSPPPGYPNDHVELVVRTHLPHSGARGTEASSRNHINVLSADCVIALPGSAGTLSEIELARRYARPLIVRLRMEEDWAALPQGVALARTNAELEAFLEAACAGRR